MQKTTKRKYQDDGASSSKYVSSWASMRQYDDDHDSQWFEDQNTELGKDSPYLNVVTLKKIYGIYFHFYGLFFFHENMFVGLIIVVIL